MINFLKNKLKPLPKILTLTTPVIMFFIWVWLLFVKLQKDVIVEIEDLIAENKWTEVIQNVEKILNKSDSPQIHLYVFGSVAKFGLEEEENLKRKTISSIKQIRDYNHELIRRDSTGIYLRESFFYRFKKFPQSKMMVRLLCDYLDYFPDALENEKKFQQLFLKTLSPEINWDKIPTVCLEQMFSRKLPFLKIITRSPKKKSRPMRMRPHINARLIRNIRIEERVFVRTKYEANAIISKENKWLYIMDEFGKSGWILSKNFSHL